jgi:hypothetical protein
MACVLSESKSLTGCTVGQATVAIGKAQEVLDRLLLAMQMLGAALDATRLGEREIAKRGFQVANGAMDARCAGSPLSQIRGVGPLNVPPNSCQKALKAPSKIQKTPGPNWLKSLPFVPLFSTILHFEFV